MLNVDPYHTLFAFDEVRQEGSILKKSFCFAEEYTLLVQPLIFQRKKNKNKKKQKEGGNPKRVKRVRERNMGVIFKINTYSAT